jgi:hypothetical protein
MGFGLGLDQKVVWWKLQDGGHTMARGGMVLWRIVVVVGTPVVGIV